MACDQIHLLELVQRYYPGSANLLQGQQATQPQAVLQLGYNLEFRKYTCCSSVCHNYYQAQSHWFSFHCEQVPSNSTEIVSSVLGFLSSFKTLPTTPKKFRPAPHSKAPLDFRNPYSQKMAMAYDFLDQIQTPEYALFQRKLHKLFPPEFPYSERKHFEIWPYWAHYYYPSLNNQVLKRLRRPMKSGVPMFPCKSEGCTKIFRQHHGLKNHVERCHTNQASIIFKPYFHTET